MKQLALLVILLAAAAAGCRKRTTGPSPDYEGVRRRANNSQSELDQQSK